MHAKKTRLKNLAWKGEKDYVSVIWAKRRTTETKKDDNMKKLCINDLSVMEAKVKSVNLHLAPKTQ